MPSSASSVSSTSSSAGGMTTARPPARSIESTYASGTSAAGSLQTPQLASWAYDVIPMTGLKAPPSPRPRVCRLRTRARGRHSGSRLTRSTRSVSPPISVSAPLAARRGRVEPPRTHLPLDLGDRPRPVDPRVLRLERAAVARLALVLGIARIPGGDALQDAWQHAADRLRDLRRELVPRVLVAERDAHLTEDVPRVELRVHVVEGEADLAVAVADRPRERARPAVARQERGMAVHDAVPRNGERSRAGSSRGSRCREPRPDRRARAAARFGRARRASRCPARAASPPGARSSPCSGSRRAARTGARPARAPASRSSADEALDGGRHGRDEDDPQASRARRGASAPSR